MLNPDDGGCIIADATLPYPQCSFVQEIYNGAVRDALGSAFAKEMLGPFRSHGVTGVALQGYEIQKAERLFLAMFWLRPLIVPWRPNTTGVGEMFRVGWP